MSKVTLQLLATPLVLGASASQIIDFAPASFDKDAIKEGFGSLHINVTSGSVKVEWVGRNNFTSSFITMSDVSSVIDASSTGEKLLKCVPIFADDLALKFTDVSGAGSTVSYATITLM